MSGLALVALATLLIASVAAAVGAEVAVATRGRSARRNTPSPLAPGERARERGQLATTSLIISGLLCGLTALGSAFATSHGVSIWWGLSILLPALMFGFMVPTVFAQAHLDAWLRWSDPIVNGFSWLMFPLVMVVRGFARLVTRVVRTDERHAFITRDELALLIESEPGTDQPQITQDEREMIANVFELAEYSVRELMVPLSETLAMPETATAREAAAEVADKQHSRMPVYRSRVDDIVGVVHVFDILQAGPDGQEKTLQTLARPAVYVPETMKATDLLVELQAEGQHLAIVVDEYGGAVGIVTVEDLLEVIVGDIDDEYDREPLGLRPERPGVWKVEAKTAVARINRELSVELPESDEYETIAGLMIDKLRRIPEVGETLSIGGVVVEVVAGTERSVATVRVTKKRK